ncbi:hypothetical protein MMC16_004599 [Acarospora aff. strigata]|nr:hypothetical protein [Acarospora aff. strigata]
MHLPLFRIFYSTTFTVLTLILIVLVLITPGDTIYQAYKNRQFYYISVIGGAYLLTLIFAILIYASRLYTNRSVLAAIPKTWIPIEKGDVGKGVRRIIVEGLARSAMIAYDTRPRNIREGKALQARNSRTPDVQFESSSGNRHREQGSGPVQGGPEKPQWGSITHAGWSSPSSVDLPNLHYEPVFRELPHLIEAKAVSLAPTDPAFLPETITDNADPPSIVPNANIVELLQRPSSMGLRDYISYLTAFNLINPPNLGTQLLVLYEQARFSGYGLTEHEFRVLMGIFAEILRNMKEIEPGLLAEALAKDNDGQDDDLDQGSNSSFAMDEEDEENDVDGEAAMHDKVLPADYRSASGSEGTIRTTPSHLHHQQVDASNQVATAPTLRQMPSETSLKRIRTVASSTASTRSGSSVIRLTEARSPLDLPYTITIPPHGGT